MAGGAAGAAAGRGGGSSAGKPRLPTMAPPALLAVFKLELATEHPARAIVMATAPTKADRVINIPLLRSPRVPSLGATEKPIKEVATGRADHPGGCRSVRRCRRR